VSIFNFSYAYMLHANVSKWHRTDYSTLEILCSEKMAR
jgi:hypothetical protein